MSVELEPVDEMCREHLNEGSSLVMFLQNIQEHYGYIPREVLKEASRRLEVPLSRLYGLATFYRSFSLTPRGKHEICICTGTACHVRGAQIILEHVMRRLGISSGETTEDGLFTLVSVNCLGACALGPVMVVDGKYHGKIDVSTADRVISELRASEQGEAK